MNRINSTLRNIAVFITLVALALAVFWLVSRQSTLQPIAQITAQPASLTDTPQPTVSPSATATPNKTPTEHPIQSQEATPEPTATPFTPEAVQATVILITPPPPPPTIGAGPLSGYKLGKIKHLPVNRENQTVLAGWTADGQSLFTFSLINQGAISTQNDSNNQNSIVTLLPLNQNEVINPQELPTNNLSPLVGRDPKFPSAPIKQPDNSDYFFYRENLSEKQFKLWMSNFDGSRQKLVTETDMSNFSVGPDGYLAYVNQNQLHIVKPTFEQLQDSILSTFSLHDISLHITDDSLNFTLSSKGDQVAVYDNQGHFYIVNTPQQTLTDISLPNTMEVQEVAWSPDNLSLAYTIGSNSDNLRSGGNILYLRNVNEGIEQVVENNYSFSNEALGVYNIRWSPNGEVLAAILSPFTQCTDCRDVLVLISQDGLHITELEKSDFLWAIEWSPNGSQIAYLCIDESYQPAEICISNLIIE